MEGCFIFQWGGLFFRWEGFIFKRGGAPWGGINFGGGGVEKNCKMGGGMTPSTMGNPARKNYRVDKYLRTYEKTVL